MWYPRGLSMKDLLGAGLSGYGGRVDGAIKWVHPKNVRYIERERRVYERLGRNPGILRYYGPVENGILLEYAHNGSIRQYYAMHGAPVPPATKLRWMQQVTSTIGFLHSKSVFHGDILCNNIFLDKNLDAKVADFAGSAIDDEEHLTCYEESHSHPSIRGIFVQTGNLCS